MTERANRETQSGGAGWTDQDADGWYSGDPRYSYTGDRSRGDHGWINTLTPEGMANDLKNFGGEGSSSDVSQTIQDILSQYLQYNPKVAQQQFDLTSLYAPKYAGVNNQLISNERQQGLEDASRLAPKLQSIRDAGSRSDVRSMRDQLYASVLGDLSMGENLTPEQNRNATQSVRSAQSARGLNGGQSGANVEAVRRALSGQALAGQRRAAASSVLASEASQSPDPFSTILGMPLTGTTAALNQTGSANNALTPSMLSQAFFGATQANQAANQYALTLELAKQNLALNP